LQKYLHPLREAGYPSSTANRHAEGGADRNIGRALRRPNQNPIGPSKIAWISLALFTRVLIFQLVTAT
jgi:hypothetical protein